jgi:hypothetical protein
MHLKKDALIHAIKMYGFRCMCIDTALNTIKYEKIVEMHEF